MQIKIVDIHPHITSNDNIKYPRAPVEGKKSAWSETRKVTMEKLLATMDEARVVKAAVPLQKPESG